jgi:anaerobic ribonucleoside-triphosphate reductase activating protein
MKYHNITKDDQNNGDGLRVVLWVAGCEHHCPGCQNQETWDKENGLLFDEGAKKELFSELSKDYISGITFSGGDPLAIYNRAAILELAKEIKDKFPNKTIWCYTGYVYEDIKDELKDFLDIIDVLVDGPFVLSERNVSLEWRGSANQRVIRLK